MGVWEWGGGGGWWVVYEKPLPLSLLARSTFLRRPSPPLLPIPILQSVRPSDMQCLLIQPPPPVCVCPGSLTRLQGHSEEYFVSSSPSGRVSV